MFSIDRTVNYPGDSIRVESAVVAGARSAVALRAATPLGGALLILTPEEALDVATALEFYAKGHTDDKF